MGTLTVQGLHLSIFLDLFYIASVSSIAGHVHAFGGVEFAMKLTVKLTRLRSPIAWNV